MSDRERLLAFLESSGLKRTVISDSYDMPTASYFVHLNGSVVRLGNGEGYNGFYVEFAFTEAGDFINHGAWE